MYQQHRNFGEANMIIPADWKFCLNFLYRIYCRKRCMQTEKKKPSLYL